MKTASFGVKLFLKSGRLKEDGTATIYARIRLDRDNKMELSTNKSIAPKHWHESGTVVKHPDAKQINKHLDAFKNRINQEYSELFIAQQEISLEAIRVIVLGEPLSPKHMLLAVAHEHDAHFKSMLGIKYSAGSYKNYKTTLKYLKEFVPIYAKKQDIPLTDRMINACSKVIALAIIMGVFSVLYCLVIIDCRIVEPLIILCFQETGSENVPKDSLKFQSRSYSAFEIYTLAYLTNFKQKLTF